MWGRRWCGRDDRGHSERAILNADAFADHAASAPDEDAVSAEIARRAADELVRAADRGDAVHVQEPVEGDLFGVVDELNAERGG